MKPLLSKIRLTLLGTVFFLGAISSPAAAEPPVRTVMKNGLVLLVQEAGSIPMVTVQVIVRAGARRDSPKTAGLAHLTAALLDAGTRNRTSARIAAEFDFMGARFSIRGGKDYTSISLQLLKKDLETGMEILSEIMLHPVFPEAELNRIRKEIQGELIAEEDQPGAVAEKEFNRILFGSHPYALPVEGTPETLDAITRGDVLGFHRLFYRPNNTIFTMVGDINNREARKLIARFFGDWTPGDVPPESQPEIQELKEPVTRLLDKNLTQANVILGHRGLKRSNPDYYAVTVMNYILGGGGFSSRLMKNIRDEKGLVYGIYSYYDALEDPGSFQVVFQTQNSQARTAVDEILRELKNIRTHPVSPGELEEAKAFLVGSFPLRFDTTSKIAGFLSRMEFHGLGLDFLNAYPDLIRSVTTHDVQRVAGKYLNPDRLAMVVVGNHEKTGLGK